MKVSQDSALLTERQDIVDLFRQRIAAGNRTKLERRERQALAKIFRDRLIQMAADRTDNCEAIERLCLDEIRLLEEGYPKNTLQSSYLPEYIKLLKEAIATGALLLTEQNSCQEQANGNGPVRRHYALDYLSYKGQARRQWNNLIVDVDEEPSVSAVPPPLLSEDKCLAIIQNLFLSSDPMALIVGIAVATGRHPYKVLTLGQLATTPDGDFNQLNLQDHAYRLRCSASGSGKSHDILTIAPAVDVLAAIHKLRSYDLMGIEESALAVQVHHLFAKVSEIKLASGTETIALLQASYGEIVKTWEESPDHQPPPLGERAQEPSADCPETAESVLTTSDLRALITTLQSTTKQQAQTIARLTGDLSRLHKELDVAKRAQSNAEAYRSKLEMIYSVFNDGLLSSGSRRKCQGQRLAGQPLTVFHRAIRIWELTQQWNREKSYTREAAIQLSKSLLTRRFGIHAKAIEQFWEHFSAEISAENERLGIVPGDIHFNRGAKQDKYIAHVKLILEQEGFYSNPPRSFHGDQG